MDKDIDAMKTQRLVLLGVVSQEEDSVKKEVQMIKADFEKLAAIHRTKETFEVALSLFTLEIVLKMKGEL